MAKNLPKHPLEKWAESLADYKFGSEKNVMCVYFETVVNQIPPESHASTPFADILTVALFAAELVTGRGHIVRMPNGLREDVMSSKVTDDEMDRGIDELHLPWDMFAIELGHDEDFCAIVISTAEFVLENAYRISEVFGVPRHELEPAIDKITERFEKSKFALITGLIPSKALIERQSEFIAEMMIDEAAVEEKIPWVGELTPGHEPTRRELIENLAPHIAQSMPLNLHKATALLPGRTDDVMPTMALVLFMCASNQKMTTIHEPGPAPKNPTKARKRSKATIHECGFEWTDAYRRYRQATESRHLGGSVRPHVRRGHYHHFWTGPRDGERKLICHWIPPTLVKGTLGTQKNQGHRIR